MSPAAAAVAPAGREWTLAWGRSIVGCERCSSPHALAGFELRCDGRLVERVCADCAGEWRPGRAHRLVP